MNVCRLAVRFALLVALVFGLSFGPLLGAVIPLRHAAAEPTAVAPAVAPSVAPAAAEPYDTGYLRGLMEKQPERFRIALDPGLAAEYRIQVLVGFVSKGAKPVLTRHGFRVDAEYFYPASALKIAAAVAAMQTVRAMATQGRQVGIHSPLIFYPLFPGDKKERDDSSNLRGGRVTLGQLVRKMAIVSSNEAFNRLYDIAGHQALNQMMWNAGLKDTIFFHRLSEVRTMDENRMTPRIDIETKTKTGTVTIPERKSSIALRPHSLPGLALGVAYIDPKTNAQVPGPMSFAEKNRMSLVDLQNMLVMLVRPDIDLGLPGFDLHRADRRFLTEAMRELPEESKNPVFSPEEFKSTRFKPVLPGLWRVFPKERWHVWNKAGKAYGFRIENAYIVDRKTNRGFFFSVAIYANPDQIVNDGKYTYDNVADPFIHDLVEAVVRDHWKMRAK